jgi:hypothetical protein
MFQMLAHRLNLMYSKNIARREKFLPLRDGTIDEPLIETIVTARRHPME